MFFSVTAGGAVQQSLYPLTLTVATIGPARPERVAKSVLYFPSLVKTVLRLHSSRSSAVITH